MKMRHGVFFCLAFVFIGFIPNVAQCQLKALDDSEMSDVYAEGFAEFYYQTTGPTTTEAVARFNINTYQFTEIASLKLGYHDEYDYKDPTPGFGWDEDWENIKIGKIEATAANQTEGFIDPTEDFHTTGLFFKAEFENIDTPATRKLKGITFGADTVEGDIKANFIQFSGTIDDSNNNTPEYNGHGLALGNKIISADDLTGDGNLGGFSISLSIDGFDKGYWVTFNEAKVTDPAAFPVPP
jgi:hypothetical protein